MGIDGGLDEDEVVDGHREGGVEGESLAEGVGCWGILS